MGKPISKQNLFLLTTLIAVPALADPGAAQRASAMDDIRSELATLRKDVDENTTRILQDKVLWSGDYTGYVDSFVDDNRVTNTHDSTAARLRHRLRLTLRASPNEFFRFTGRISAYKKFSGVGRNQAGVTEDPNYSTLRPSADPFLRLDRMYIDIFPPTKWISGAFGLFPSTEGLPDLHRLQARKSTFPNLMFNVPFAAAILALHPKELWNRLPDSHFWFIYSANHMPGKRTSLGYTWEDATRFELKETSQILIGVGEVNPSVSWAEKLTISASYGTIRNYKVTSDTTEAAAYRSLGINFQPGEVLGDLDRIALFTQAEHIRGTGLNAFLGFAATPMSNDPIDKEVTATQVTGVQNAPYKAKVGLQGSIHKENEFGKALYTGVSFDWDHQSTRYFGTTSVGYDFYLPEKNFVAMYLAGDDITERFESLGPSHRFFITQPITDAFKLNLSYTYMLTRYRSDLLEVSVPAQGPGTVSGVTVINATQGTDSNSIVRTGRELHTIQLSAMLSF